MSVPPNKGAHKTAQTVSGGYNPVPGNHILLLSTDRKGFL
jgi:hypothetical protein